MRKMALVIAIPLALLALAYVMASYDLSTGSELPLFSSRRFDPYGSSAFRELLVERGVEVRFLERPAPASRTGETLVMILPMETKLETRRLERLTVWVEKGNRLVVLSRDPPAAIADELFMGDGRLSLSGTRRSVLDFEQDQASGDYQAALEPVFGEVIVPSKNGGEGVASLALTRPSRVDCSESAFLKPLAGPPERAVLVAKNKGQGKILLLTDPTPILNYALSRADNADVLLSLLAPGKVYFDEYSLGLGYQESMLDWIKRSGLLPFLLQALLVLYLLARSGRTDFTSPTADQTDDKATAEIQIRILGGLYENTLTAQEIAERLERCRSRVPPNKSKRKGKKASLSRSMP